MLTPMSTHESEPDKALSDKTTADVELPDLGAAIKDFVATNYSPSGIVAVARNGSILQSRTWGDDGYDVRTAFRIASCTKSFTALALLILRRQGRLGLDDAVVEHLPELKVDAPADGPTLRLRHLLSMSAGLATDNPWGDRQEARTRDELSAWLSAGLRLIFPPGSAYEYSNLGYSMLGEVISRVSGQDYRDYVRQHIIDPLGLSDTRFEAAELATVAEGYHREPALPGQPGGWTLQTPSGPGVFSPIGGLYSSARDLATWAGLYLSREAPVGVDFTAADLLEAQQPLNPIVSGAAEAPLRGYVSLAYGYGLGIETFSDHGTVVAHSGGYPGFTTYMCWHKESGYTVIASANGTHSAVPGPARRVLFSLVAAASGGSKGDTGKAKAGKTSGAVEPWPETRETIARIEQLVREAQSKTPHELAGRHADLFAENVEMDFPLSRRIEYLKQALVGVGQLNPSSEANVPTFERKSCARC